MRYAGAEKATSGTHLPSADWSHVPHPHVVSMPSAHLLEGDIDTTSHGIDTSDTSLVKREDIDVLCS